MRRITTFAAALLAIVPSIAEAAQPPCLSPGEFSALAEYALPSVISGTSQRCTSRLAPNAYLRREGPQLVRRYAERRPTAWPGAKAAFLKLSATDADAGNLVRTLPDASLQQMLSALMEGVVAQQIPLERCGTIDRVVGLLAPLPAQNVAELIALAVGLGARTGRGKLGAISICDA